MTTITETHLANARLSRRGKVRELYDLGDSLLLVASDREFSSTHPQHWENAVIYRPKSLVLGIGCDRGTPAELVERGVSELLARHGL